MILWIQPVLKNRLRWDETNTPSWNRYAVGGCDVGARDSSNCQHAISINIPIHFSTWQSRRAYDWGCFHPRIQTTGGSFVTRMQSPRGLRRWFRGGMESMAWNVGPQQYSACCTQAVPTMSYYVNQVGTCWYVESFCSCWEDNLLHLIYHLKLLLKYHPLTSHDNV